MAVSTTGSRNLLTAWAVTASVLGLGSLIWAVISYTQANKAEKDLKDLGARYKDVIDVAGLSGDDFTQLKAIKDDASRGYGGMPLLQIARRQTEALTTLIAGAGAANDKIAIADIEAEQKKAVEAGGKDVTIGTSSLKDTLSTLTAAVTTLKADKEALTKSLTEAQASAKAAEEDRAKIDAAANDKVASAVKTATDADARATAYSSDRDAALTEAQKLTADVTQKGVLSAEEMNNQMNALRQQNAALKHELDDRNAQLGRFRVPTDQILKQADGVIVRTTGSDRVVINLGRGDHIAAGMTFEVFDKLGVPTVREGEPSDDKLLKGKASIEVVKTEAGISTCRVVRQSPGLAITEGDPIVNVVYDKNVPLNFMVYGKFNLDYKGDANDRDTDIVRRLIGGWGANVADKLDAKTDFVVLGEEPVVPDYSADQLAREPEKAFEKEQAETALEQFTDLRAKAQQLNIPVLNQTRFLYMIGYYEEGKR
jgi:regulator of replication initiation timing